MKQVARTVTLILVGLLASVPARAQEPGVPPSAPGTDYRVVIGAGGAVELERPGSAGVGASAFVELTAIDNWLELELAGQLLAIDGGQEASADLLFKKPFQLRDRVDLMVGLGPTVVQTHRSGQPDDTAWGASVALDLMIWPWGRVGAWVEPSYDLVFGGGRTTQSLSVTAGPIVGF